MSDALVLISADTPLYRIHRRSLGAVYYCNDGRCRFDPQEQEAGALYVGRTPMAAFLEKFGRLRFVTRDKINDHFVTRLEPSSDTFVFDLTAPEVLGMGYPADVQVGSEYARPQALARELLTAGIDGVHYGSRHDPELKQRSIAFLGRKVVGGLPHSGAHVVEIESEPIEDALIEQAETYYGIRVLRRTPLIH